MNFHMTKNAPIENHVFTISYRGAAYAFIDSKTLVGADDFTGV